MRSSAHVDNRKDISDKSPTKRLDDTTLTAEKEYATTFSDQCKKFCLSLHYNEANSYAFVSSVKIYKLKAKHSEKNATHYV